MANRKAQAKKSKIKYTLADLNRAWDKGYEAGSGLRNDIVLTPRRHSAVAPRGFRGTSERKKGKGEHRYEHQR